MVNSRRHEVTLGLVRSVRLVAVILVLLAAAVSCWRGFINALRQSQDLQWSPTVVFLHGRSPYEVLLSGDPGGEIILSQTPNYLPLLYVLLAPFGLLDFGSAKIAWAALNIVAMVGTTFLLTRWYGLNLFKSVIIVAIVLASTPVRVAIGNGQQSILVFAFLCLPFLWPSPAGRIASGVGYVKYSFAPPFFFYMLFRYRMRGGLQVLLLPVAGYVVFAGVTGTALPALVTAPLLVASSSVGTGLADWMSLSEQLVPEGVARMLITYLPPVAASFAVAWAVARLEDARTALAVLCLAALLAFKHLVHDWIFLVPLFCLLLSRPLTRLSYVGLAFIGWVFFGMRLLDLLADGHQTTVAAVTFAWGTGLLLMCLQSPPRAWGETGHA